MSAVVKSFPSKPNRDKGRKITKFMEQLEVLKVLYLQGTVSEIVIIARGKEKCCTSNQISIKTAKEICRDYLENTKEYTG